MSQRLAGKIAIVTGTAGGQGRAVARRFAQEGASVIGCDLNADGAEATVDQVLSEGGTISSVHPVDLIDEDDVKRVIKTAIDSYGGLDIVYNNAMAARSGGPEDLALEDFRFTMDHVLAMPFLMTKYAIPHLRARGGGVIINVTSITGMDTGGGAVGNIPIVFPYATAKGGLIRMSQHTAIQLAMDDIRVNTLSPGLIDTSLAAPLVGPEGSLTHRATMEHMLMGRLGTVDEIADGAVYLASDEASYVTGHNLVIDGGWRVSGGSGRPRPEILAEIAARAAGSA
jgi:meso-butanediol dehydrogenase/(S,S)-butanediol dehydrogenase/diacetyl reductase